MSDALPDVEVTASDGAVFRTSDWLGRPLVLFCYPRASTPGCTREAQEFSAHRPRFDALGVHVAGVSRDTPAKLTRFAEGSGLTVPLIADHNGALTDALGVWVKKSMYGRTSMGIERATFLFDAEGERLESWRKVRVAGHADAVLAQVEERFGG